MHNHCLACTSITYLMMLVCPHPLQLGYEASFIQATPKLVECLREKELKQVREEEMGERGEKEE